MKSIFNFTLTLLLILLVWNQCGDGKTDPISILAKENTDMKFHIGTKVKYEKDSVYIVNYSIWRDTYTLSNGIEVHKNLYPQLTK